MLTEEEIVRLKDLKNIAVVGGRGFVGSAVVDIIAQHRTGGCTVVTRGDDLCDSLADCDLVIHCANSPRRYKAELDAEYDFIESVQKTFEIMSVCNSINSRLLLVSSISARSQIDTTYGRNRRACEMMTLAAGYPVVRLGYMYSSSKVYGALENILNNHDVYLSSQSTYSYSDVLWNAEKIVSCALTQRGTIRELGARGGINLRRIADILQSRSRFVSEKIDIQIARCDFADKPDISEFELFLSKLK